jgi:hypothetical protein
MLFSNVFVYIEPRNANQNLRRSISPSAAAVPSLHLCHGDEKPISTTLLIPVTYKCPLPQPLSFDILTNAPGVWGSTSPFLKSYLNSFCSQRAFSRKKCICKSPVFFALRTLPSSVSCKPRICHSYENCRVYTNNSHSETPASPLPPVTSHKSPVTSMPHRPRIMSAPNQGDAFQ